MKTLVTAFIFITLLSVGVPGQCRAPRPLHVLTTATNPNAALFTGTILIGTVESDAGENPLVIVNLANQDTNVFNPLWNPQKYVGPTASPWTAASLGNLYGLTMDGSGNIYAASAGMIFVNGTTTGTLSGNHSGALYKIDATTGLASSFINLTQDDVNLSADPVNNGPGIGNIASNYATPLYLYASNFEDGLVYRLNSTGGIVDTYDHGVQGRPNALNIANLEVIADTSATSGYYSQIPSGITLPGRRIWAVEVYNNRLYYSVWWTTSSGGLQSSWYASGINISNENTTNEVWSVGLNADGSFNTASVRREFSMGTVGGQGSQEPVTDIIFTPNGRMLLATRGIALDGGINGNFHKGILVELSGSYPSWTANSTKFRIGQNGADGSGGLAYDPSGNSGGGRVWTTGEALFEGAFNNIQANTFGFQGMNDNGANQTNQTSVLVDADGVQMQEKGSIGDVDIACVPLLAASVNVGGRVSEGRNGVANAVVTVTNTGTLETHTTRTNSFGYYSFQDLEVGHSYIITVSHRRYDFAGQNIIFQLFDEINDLNFQTGGNRTGK